MNLRSAIGSSVIVVLVVVLLGMLVGQQIGQPIFLGFVVTGSMSPTLEPGDGFVAVPTSLAGDVEQGDVVTFNARQLQGGGLTTHRIVGETEQGYITQGDANPFTDQDSNEPPVQESQIKAVALQSGGNVVVIPNLGTVATAAQSGVETGVSALSQVPGLGGLANGDARTIMIGTGGLLLVYSFVSDRVSAGRRGISRSDSRDQSISAVFILVMLLLFITVPLTASMMLPSGIDTISIVSSTSANSNPTVIQQGGSQSVNYSVSNNGFLPRVAVIEPASTGVTVNETTHVLWRGDAASSSAVIYAPEETGVYVRSVSQWQYVLLVPLPVLLSLHAIHPFVAVATINAVVIVGLTALFVVAVGLEPFRFRDRSGNASFGQRLRRKIRRWF
jgi:signal peptidase